MLQSLTSLGKLLCAADRDYHFTTKQQLLSDVRSKKFLEAARVNVHSRPCTSSAAAAAAAPPQPLSYWYGTSLATVREVAATGKLCIMSLDVQGAQVRWRLRHMTFVGCWDEKTGTPHRLCTHHVKSINPVAPASYMKYVENDNASVKPSATGSGDCAAL